MEFEKWLKRERMSMAKIQKVEHPLEVDVITVRALGEWAIDRVLANDYNIQIYDIAVACLGKAEVEKRLKEMKE